MNTSTYSTKSKCSIKDILKLTQSEPENFSKNHEEYTPTTRKESNKSTWTMRKESNKIMKDLYSSSSGDVINNLYLHKTSKMQKYKFKEEE